MMGWGGSIIMHVVFCVAPVRWAPGLGVLTSAETVAKSIPLPRVYGDNPVELSEYTGLEAGWLFRWATAIGFVNNLTSIR